MSEDRDLLWWLAHVALGVALWLAFLFVLLVGAGCGPTPCELHGGHDVPLDCRDVEVQHRYGPCPHVAPCVVSHRECRWTCSVEPTRR